MSAEDTLFEFDSEVTEAPAAGSDAVWQVLVVDDEADVHAATEFALAGVEILGRPLALLHARSAAEAYALMAARADIAVVLLDVVMESPDAGLRLVGRIRRELGNSRVRVILRTGQPGYAPEMEAVRDFDINDYRSKSELTRTRLYTSLTAALRSYSQLDQLARQSRGLGQLIAATRELLELHALDAFAHGLLGQLQGWLGSEGDALVCLQRPGEGEQPQVLAGRGAYRAAEGGRLVEHLPTALCDEVADVLRSGEGRVRGRRLLLPFRTLDHDQFLAVLPLAPDGVAPDPALLRLFGENMALCARHQRLIERLTESAYVDPMLGIPNRTALLGLIQQRQSNGGGVLMLIDLVQFAETNETFGFQYADDLLRAISSRLVERFGERAAVARVAGDIFALVGDSETLRPRLVQAVFAAPLPVQGEQHIAAVCTGSVDFDGEQPAQDLIKDASMALKTAKANGPGSHQEFVPGIAAATSERTRLLHELRAAFEADRLYLVYQPQVALASGRCVGVEALLRWRNDRDELVPPDRFVPVAEQSGLIVPLGCWVIGQAAAMLARLQAAGHHDLRVAVNVSPAQLQSEQFLSDVNDALARSGIEPRQLEIEVTESIAILGAERAAGLLARLRELGVSVALDDFGTGYSSLSYVQRLPLDRIKIDRAFISPMLAQPQSARIVDVILLMGHELGLTLVAEGVENAEQASRLRALGCHEAQGYHFAAPMDENRLVAWLREPAR